MKHIPTFESFLNEGSLIKKEGTGEIAVKKNDKAKAEKIMAAMNQDFEDLGAKDSSSLNYFKLPNSNWDIMNKIGSKVDLQSMTILEANLKR
jgi:hypothetical protein